VECCEGFLELCRVNHAEQRLRRGGDHQIRRSGHIVHGCPSRPVRWADIPGPSVRVGRHLVAWQQVWQQPPHRGTARFKSLSPSWLPHRAPMPITAACGMPSLVECSLTTSTNAAAPRSIAPAGRLVNSGRSGGVQSGRWRAGHIPGCYGSRERCALSLVAAACRWSLPLLSARRWPSGSKPTRTLQGMARVRSGQAQAWPLSSDRSVRRGSRIKRDFACTFTRHFPPVLVALRSQSCLRLEGRARTLSGPSPALSPARTHAPSV
jgi:hypothetical protein